MSYQSMPNFVKSFAKPISLKLLNEEYNEIDGVIEKIGTQIGTGDDVYCSMILKSMTSKRNYKG